MNNTIPKNAVSNDAWQRRVITTGFVGGLIGACTAVAAASVFGTVASAHNNDDLVDVGGVAQVGEGDVATVGVGLNVDGLGTELPTCVPADDGSGDGSGNGGGSGDGSGDGSGNGGGSGDGSGDGSGNGDGGGSLIDVDGIVDVDDALHPLTGRNLLDASIFGDAGNTWGGDLLTGAGDVVIGGHHRSQGAFIDVDGVALLDPSK